VVVVEYAQGGAGPPVERPAARRAEVSVVPQAIESQRSRQAGEPLTGGPVDAAPSHGIGASTGWWSRTRRDLQARSTTAPGRDDQLVGTMLPLILGTVEKSNDVPPP